MSKKQMEIRALKFEVRDLDSASGEFSGVASAFNVLLPGYSEKMVPGSLDRTLQHNSGHVPIFKNHNIDLQVGFGIDGKANNKTFDVIGRLEIQHNAVAREQLALIEMAKGIEKAKMGLSIGFRVIRETYEKIKGQSIRLIEEIDLMEYSITPFPANPKAWITDTRSIHDIANDLRGLSEDEYRNLMALLRPAQGTPGLADDLSVDSQMHSIASKFSEITKRLKGGY